MDRNLLSLLKEVPEIPEDRNYWFIRTEAGFLYDSFLQENVVAIGYTKIKVREPQGKNKSVLKDLIDQVQQKYPDVTRPGLIARQVLIFNREIKNGDVVIIPGVASQELSFGIVMDDVPAHRVLVLGKGKSEERIERMVRKVEWVKSVSKRRLNPHLFSLFFAHQTISNGNDYAEYIDSTLSDFFLKSGKAHLQLPVQRDADINARHLFKSCIGLLDLTDKFLESEKRLERTTDIEVKININSPGMIEFIGHSVEVVAMLGLVIVGVNGGGFKAKFGQKVVELKTPGIIGALSKFLDEQAKRKALGVMVEELKMQDSKDIKEVITKLVK